MIASKGIALTEGWHRAALAPKASHGGCSIFSNPLGTTGHAKPPRSHQAKGSTFGVSAHQAVSLAYMSMGLLKPNLRAPGGEGNFSQLEGNGTALKLSGSCSSEHRRNQTSTEAYQLHPMHNIPSCQS